MFAAYVWSPGRFLPSSITPCCLTGVSFETKHATFETISKHLKEEKELHISDLPQFQLSPASVCESSLQLVREKQPNSETNSIVEWKKAASVFDLCRQQYKETFVENVLSLE